MTFALALGGGASRGLAHIGVIKYIEENNINISEISGTSMGAIIGACFAIGIKSDKMIKFISDINFIKLVDLNLKDAIVSGDKVYEKLKELYGEKLIEETNIPLKIVATNFDTGEKKVFTKGKIIDAVRASISLPSIFSPYIINNEKYIDGGIRENLPILELENKDIIAVSVVRENIKILGYKTILNINFKKWIFRNTYETLKKTISIIMANNEDLSLEIAKLNGKNIILLKPNVGEFEYFDFIKYNEISNRGYTEAKNNLLINNNIGINQN